ncbi:alpha/beta hydrolase [Pseudomonas sp. BMS12]|uniref:alpha/beta hydrolase n=1 Tax=Pseudomonas sp. BMS12 TaxID=1796033 RepID=UPI00083B37DF|nr:alpha/beta hydrolase [Pseudomonas sp. BMS12]
MPLDKQIAAVLQQFSGLPQPDFSQLEAAGYRQVADHMMPPLPGESMAEVRDLRVAGAAGALQARLYRPRDEANLPLLVFFHGGGFVIGTLDTHDNLCRSLAAQSGALVVSVAYRLAPESPFPAAPLDCYRATLDLFARADELGVDASRLALAGDSAGANLAIAVARQVDASGGPRIAALGLLYPVTDGRCGSSSYQELAEGYFLTREQMLWFWRQYLAEPAQADDPLASPLLAEDLDRLPPTSLLTAEFDPLRDEGEAFAERLRQVGVPVRAKRCLGMIHGFASMAPFVEQAAAELAEFSADLRQALS